MSNEIVITEEAVINKIYIIRDKKAMLDRDLAELYNVTTGNLNKAVGRNLKRFPEDFMFELSKQEFENLKKQINASKKKLSNQGKNIELVFNYLDELIEKKDKPRVKIDYKK